MLSHILEIYFRPIQIQYMHIYFCLFEDPMQLSPATILGWTAIFDFHVEGQRAECFFKHHSWHSWTGMWSATASPLRLHISLAASATGTRHILRTVSVNIQRLVSKRWWAFQKHTSEANTPPPKGKPCDAQGILSCTYTRCSKTGWEGWLLHMWKGCLHKREF